MPEAVIVEAARTPIGKRGGWLSGLHPVELLAAAQIEVVKRSGIDASQVEQIVGGCVTQAGGEAFNLTRKGWVSAGVPHEGARPTPDRPGGSGQQANHFVSDFLTAGA